jgi:hypothetical protein
MSDPKKPEVAPAQLEDLSWQREGESENLQKSERPDGEYMNDRGLCVQCQGVKRVCELPACPQKVS